MSYYQEKYGLLCCKKKFCDVWLYSRFFSTNTRFNSLSTWFEYTKRFDSYTKTKGKISVDSAALSPTLENFAQMYQQMAAGLLNMSLDKLIPPGHPLYTKENSITILKEEKEKILKENLELKKKLENKKQ